MKRLLFTLAIVVSMSVGLTAPGAGATPKEKANHCVTPSGVDLNELWGVGEQIVAGTCTKVGSGEHWRPSSFPWFVNYEFEVVPEGFVPAGATPAKDFAAKLSRVRYVIDPGTMLERSYVLENDGSIASAISFGFPAFNTLTLGTLKAPAVGDHVVEISWTFSAMHCDGFGGDTGPGGNCLPPGETHQATWAFAVTPGRF